MVTVLSTVRSQGRSGAGAPRNTKSWEGQARCGGVREELSRRSLDPLGLLWAVKPSSVAGRDTSSNGAEDGAGRWLTRSPPFLCPPTRAWSHGHRRIAVTPRDPCHSGPCPNVGTAFLANVGSVISSSVDLSCVPTPSPQRPHWWVSPVTPLLPSLSCEEVLLTFLSPNNTRSLTKCRERETGRDQESGRHSYLIYTSQR